ncbi:type II toxin-antitoxin system RelE/ParE family toxin [Patescibacteria group bacterium]|nr:type II toxin-antitoxin system RelE/ParE family toxin [Patescibacteria group bacterium]
MAKVIYYTTSQGKNPVEIFLDSLEKKDKAKIIRILQYVEIYGSITTLPHVKKLSGTPFWEIRILGKINIRVLYVTLDKAHILLVHGFFKKKQKTPIKEIEIAINRMKNWQNRTKTS